MARWRTVWVVIFRIQREGYVGSVTCSSIPYTLNLQKNVPKIQETDNYLHSWWVFYIYVNLYIRVAIDAGSCLKPRLKRMVEIKGIPGLPEDFCISTARSHPPKMTHPLFSGSRDVSFHSGNHGVVFFSYRGDGVTVKYGWAMDTSYSPRGFTILPSALGCAMVKTCVKCLVLEYGHQSIHRNSYSVSISIPGNP